MPCDVYKQLAETEKSNRQSYSYFAFNRVMAGMSERKRTQLMKDHMAAFTTASNAMWQHRQSCKICSVEPPQNFIDPDPWSKNIPRSR